MKSLQLTACLMVIISLAACGGASQAQVEHGQASITPSGSVPGDARIRMIIIPADTELVVSLDTALSSDTRRDGAYFSATLVEPIVIENSEAIPAGSIISGKVTRDPAGATALSFSVLRLPTGFSTSIVGTIQEAISPASETSELRAATIVGGESPFAIKLKQAIRVPPRAPGSSSRS